MSVFVVHRQHRTDQRLAADQEVPMVNPEEARLAALDGGLVVRSAADVLAGHVLFELEAIDRMYLNVYQPRLQHGAEIAAFFVGHRGTGLRPRR
jgi:hypothetical protein